jgi:hypothetical protein
MVKNQESYNRIENEPQHENLSLNSFEQDLESG